MKNHNNNGLHLKAMQCYTRDSGKKIARIDSEAMKKLGIVEGDRIEVIRTRAVELSCLRVFANDEGRNIIRLDREDCFEAGATFGDQVSVRKISH
jgi:transitional endoplasmic reticulum ATPase